MLPRIFSLMAWLAVAGSLGVAACTPTQGSEGVLSVNNQGTEVASSSIVNPSTQPGSAEPGAAQEAVGMVEPGPTPSGTQVVYTDAKYKFSVLYPSNFIFSTISADKLPTLTLKPEVVFLIMNPTTASSQVPDEPGDLEIRIYDPAGITLLDRWLTSVGLASRSDSSQPFNTANISGMKVCASTLIFPQCRYFVLRNGWVYQLTSVTLEGESMFNSFKFLP